VFIPWDRRSRYLTGTTIPKSAIRNTKQNRDPCQTQFQILNSKFSILVLSCSPVPLFSCSPVPLISTSCLPDQLINFFPLSSFFCLLSCALMPCALVLLCLVLLCSYALCSCALMPCALILLCLVPLFSYALCHFSPFMLPVPFRGQTSRCSPVYKSNF